MMSVVGTYDRGFLKGLRATPDAPKSRNHFSFLFFFYFNWFYYHRSIKKARIIFFIQQIIFLLDLPWNASLVPMVLCCKVFVRKSSCFFFLFWAFTKENRRESTKIVDVFRKKYDLRQTFFTSKSDKPYFEGKKTSDFRVYVYIQKQIRYCCDYDIIPRNSFNNG